MADFKQFLKQEEISIQAINSLVCNAIVCDICKSRSVTKIIPNKMKIQKRFRVYSQAVKVCDECLEKINEMR